MKRTVALLASVLVVVALTLSATGQDRQRHMMQTQDMQHRMMPETDGKACWMYMTEVSPYEGWGLWPGHKGMEEGKSPHGAYVKVTANPVALKAARKGMKEMPEGSIIMKENYDKDKNLVALTPMYKVKGYNPEGGDWFWMKYKPDGTVDAAGKLKGCIDCHAKVKKNDWIFHPVGKE